MYDNFDALILSAGLSSRMGKTKALLDWHGRKLIEFHIDVLRDIGIRNINLVLGHDKEKITETISLNSNNCSRSQKMRMSMVLKNDVAYYFPQSGCVLFNKRMTLEIKTSATVNTPAIN